MMERTRRKIPQNMKIRRGDVPEKVITNQADQPKEMPEIATKGN